MAEVNINKILRTQVRNLSRGAPMGDTDETAGPLKNLRCQRVNLVDGGYAPDGTYWGASSKAGYIYCAFNDGQEDDEYAPACGVRIYVRAHTYEQAKREVGKRYPGTTFVRGGR